MAPRNTLSPSASRPSSRKRSARMYCRRAQLRTEPQRGPILGLGVVRAATAREEVPQCGSRFRPFSIEALRGDQLRRDAFCESFAIGERLARGRHCGEQRDRCACRKLDTAGETINGDALA